MRLPKSSKDLESAILDDQRRQAVDDAKKRAVSQHVDYDTFKNMVLTAHLKPIQAPSAPREGPMLPAWQVDPRGRPLASAATAAAPTALAASQAREQEQLPGTAAEFERAWRRRSTSERLELLRMVTPEQLPRIFRVEISAEVLGQIVQVLQQSWAAGSPTASDCTCPEATFISQALLALTSCGRFTLALRLLGRVQKQALAALLHSLSTASAAGAGAAVDAQQGGDTAGGCTSRAGGSAPSSSSATAAGCEGCMPAEARGPSAEATGCNAFDAQQLLPPCSSHGSLGAAVASLRLAYQLT